MPALFRHADRRVRCSGARVDIVTNQKEDVTGLALMQHARRKLSVVMVYARLRKRAQPLAHHAKLQNISCTFVNSSEVYTFYRRAEYLINMKTYKEDEAFEYGPYVCLV